jgi:monovalent cation:H+ antiporter, CPA1 family
MERAGAPVIESWVVIFVAVLALSAAVAVIGRWVPVPYVTLLAVLGAVLGPLVSGRLPQPSHSLILFVLLPGLLFEAAFNLRWTNLRDNLLAVSLLATLGVIVTTALVAAFGHLALGLPVALATIFGAAVAATDPVAVVATVRRLGAPSRLCNLIEAESLLNDGTGVVVFTIALAAAGAASFSLGGALLDFLRLTGGGLGLGILLGLAMSRLTRHLDDPQVEMTLTAITAYGGYLLAETLHVSGILCVVGAGIVVGNYGRPRGMSERTQAAVTQMWEYVAFVLNSLVFLLIGATVPLSTLIDHLGLVAAGVALVLAVRAAMVYGLLALVRPLGRPISLRWQHLLVWSGLRGAVAVALVLSLPSGNPDTPTIRALVYGVVLGTLLIQGATIRPVVRLILPHAERPAPPAAGDPARA